ncbi:MAG TPA: HAD family hydrolase [Ktedonobacterales bacterium]
MLPRALILDIEGTLLHTRRGPHLAPWEARLGLARGQLAREALAIPAALRARLGLVHDADIWLELACLYRLHAREMRSLARDFHAGERVAGSVARLLREALDELPIALVANGWPGLRARLSAQVDLPDLAVTTIISAEEGLVLPDTRLYELACERLGFSPAEALFVGARAAHLAGAHDGGHAILRWPGAPKLRRMIAVFRAGAVRHEELVT